MTTYDVTNGKGMDVSFIGKPHEHDPRRVYSTTSTDWQARVDFDRLRGDRLARARLMMEKHDLGAVRLEENLLVTKDGPVIFTKHPFDDTALS